MSPSTPVPRSSTFGTLADGRTVTRFEVGEGPVRLAVLDLGAAVHSLLVPGPDGPVDVVLGGPTPEAYEKQPPDFFGAVVGRVANRVAGARFDLDGTTYALQANEGEHTLHGGHDGFHTQLWEVVEHTADRLVLRHDSPDGAAGFPGALRAEAAYDVSDDGVTVTLTGVPDRATPVALTQHTHVDLAGEASGSVLDHVLSVAASRYTPVDDELIPTGELADVAGTPLDHREPRQVAVDLDHDLVLDADAVGGDRPAAVLRDPTSGLTLTLHTDAPGLQVYAGAGFDGSVVGKGGTAYAAGAGIALEPQLFPDAVHHRGEPGWPDPVHTPDRPFSLRLRWTFSLT